MNRKKEKKKISFKESCATVFNSCFNVDIKKKNKIQKINLSLHNLKFYDYIT